MSPLASFLQTALSTGRSFTIGFSGEPRPATLSRLRTISRHRFIHARGTSAPVDHRQSPDEQPRWAAHLADLATNRARPRHMPAARNVSGLNKYKFRHGLVDLVRNLDFMSLA